MIHIWVNKNYKFKRQSGKSRHSKKNGHEIIMPVSNQRITYLS